LPINLQQKCIIQKLYINFLAQNHTKPVFTLSRVPILPLLKTKKHEFTSKKQYSFKNVIETKDLSRTRLNEVYFIESWPRELLGFSPRTRKITYLKFRLEIAKKLI